MGDWDSALATLASMTVGGTLELVHDDEAMVERAGHTTEMTFRSVVLEARS